VGSLIEYLSLYCNTKEHFCRKRFSSDTYLKNKQDDTYLRTEPLRTGITALSVDKKKVKYTPDIIVIISIATAIDHSSMSMTSTC
jgi:hypothetical protein